MADRHGFVATVLAIGLIALGHAAITWPRLATVAFFGGGAIVAFTAEAVAINRGWLAHHIGPKLLGVPIYLLFGWTGTIYIAFRVALLVADGWLAVLVAGVLATSYDVLIDHRQVTNGYWSYGDGLGGPRFRGVPWWNFAAWLVISCLTAALALPFL